MQHLTTLGVHCKCIWLTAAMAGNHACLHVVQEYVRQNLYTMCAHNVAFSTLLPTSRQNWWRGWQAPKPAR